MKIMKKSKNLQYYEGPNGKMSYFHLIGAAGDRTQLFKVYKSTEYEKVSVGMTCVFENVVLKPDKSMYVVGSSKLMFSSPVTVNDSLQIPTLPEEEPPAGAKRTLQEALKSPSKSTIRGKIVKVSPLKFRLEGTLPVRCIGVKDETGYAKVVAFADQAEASYELNTAIEVSAVYTKQWKNQPQLNLSKNSTCQFISSSDVDVDINKDDIEHFLNDGDFAIDSVETAQDLVLDGIYEAISYDACTNEACRKKKMVDGICPSCQGDSSKWTYRAKVSITGERLKKEIVLFEDNLQKLFGVSTPRPDDALIRWLVQSLPVQFNAKVMGNNLYRIEKK